MVKSTSPLLLSRAQPTLPHARRVRPPAWLACVEVARIDFDRIDTHGSHRGQQKQAQRPDPNGRTTLASDKSDPSLDLTGGLPGILFQPVESARPSKKGLLVACNSAAGSARPITGAVCGRAPPGAPRSAVNRRRGCCCCCCC